MISPFPRHQNLKNTKRFCFFFGNDIRIKLSFACTKSALVFLRHGSSLMFWSIASFIWKTSHFTQTDDAFALTAYLCLRFCWLTFNDPRDRLAHDSRRPWQFRRRFFIFHYVPWLWRFFPSFFTTRRRWKFVFVCQIKVGVRMTPAHTPPSMTQRWKPLQTKEKTNLDNPQSQVYPPDRIFYFYKKK